MNDFIRGVLLAIIIVAVGILVSPYLNKSITGFQVAGECGNGICEPGESPLTCPQDCGVPGPTCGDRTCDPGEDCSSCPTDCGACVGGGVGGGGGGVGGGGGGGGTPDGPPPPKEEPPPSEQDILIPPGENVPPPSPGETITVPPGGVNIELEPGIRLSIFPLKRFNATIYNITKVQPATYKILLCNQTSIAAYEINVSADLAYFCASYKGFDIEEPTVSVFRFKEGNWTELPPLDLIKNTTQKVVCGRIASTPYMVSGVITSKISEQALLSIKLSNSSIREAKNSGLDVTEPIVLLQRAISAFYRCEYANSKTLADEARFSIPFIFPNVPLWVWIVVSIVVVIPASILGYIYYNLKKRVAVKELPKVKKKIKRSKRKK